MAGTILRSVRSVVGGINPAMATLAHEGAAAFGDKSELVHRHRAVRPTRHNQIRQHGAGRPINVLHLLEAIVRIAQHVVLLVQLAVLRAQSEAVMTAAHNRMEDALDLQSIKARHAVVQRTFVSAARRCGVEVQVKLA